MGDVNLLEDYFGCPTGDPKPPWEGSKEGEWKRYYDQLSTYMEEWTVFKGNTFFYVAHRPSAIKLQLDSELVPLISTPSIVM